MTTTPRILVVEDDAVLVIDLQEMLTQMGYQVVGMLATGKDAVNLARSQNPDAILMDIHLRGSMNGIQAANEIHLQQDTPIIYLTAYTDEILVQQAKVTEAYGYLAKPVRERELRAALEMALYKYAAEKRHRHITQVLRAVRGVNQIITRERDPQRLMGEAVKILLRTRGYRAVWIGRMTEETYKTLAFAGENMDQFEQKIASAPLEHRKQLPRVAALLTQRWVISNDMLQDERYLYWHEDIQSMGLRSSISVPIHYQDTFFAVLVVYADQADRFDDEEVDLLIEMADDIAFGLKAIEKEAALRESEQKFRGVIEQSYDGYALTDEQGMVIEWNSAMEKLTGIKNQDVLGQPLWQAQVQLASPANRSPEFMERVRQYIQRYLANGQAPDQGYPDEILIHLSGGERKWAQQSAFVVVTSKGNSLACMMREITERKRVENISQARLRITDFAAEHSLAETLQNAIDELCALADSPIGFFHYVEKDEQTLLLQAWSTRTLKEMCSAEGKGSHYKIDQAGVWADCARERRPVIHNDYPNLPDRKGMPAGHAAVIREMVFPIMRNDKIVAIIGVGNKPQNYTDEDADYASKLADLIWDVVERKRAEEQVKQSLAEKTTLLRELYHRTKNNMAVLIALLEIQAEDEDDAKLRQALMAARGRVHSMALVHQKLYDAQDLSRLNLKEYIRDLVNAVMQKLAAAPNVTVIFDMEDVFVLIDSAAPCGLILNELLSNVFQHAFPGGMGGEINIYLRRALSGEIALRVADNGIGLPAGFDLHRDGRMGVRIVFMLGEGQLRGQVNFDSQAGLSCEIKFQDIFYNPRV